MQLSADDITQQTDEPAATHIKTGSGPKLAFRIGQECAARRSDTYQWISEISIAESVRHFWGCVCSLRHNAVPRMLSDDDPCLVRLQGQLNLE
jgi:hypothetical protein